MDYVFDELIGLLRAQPTWNWRPTAMAWAFRLAGNVTIGVGIAVGRALAG